MDSALERFAATVELHRTGVALMRQNLCRHHPDADDDTIDQLLDDWLLTRPGAEHGDGQQPTVS